MSKLYIEDKDFKGEDFSQRAPGTGEYENCTFTACSFLHADLSGVIFSGCRFEDCDLSLATLKNTALREIRFKNCKLLGLRFDDCNNFSLALDFETCTLNLSSFYQVKLKNTRFKDCKLVEVDFVETDLSNAVFSECDLSGATFERTLLEGADFRTAFHFSIDPEINRIGKARFSTQNIAGLLHKYNIAIE